jgi:hypothetical protein
VQEWGVRAYQARVSEALHGFVRWSPAWLRVERVQGAQPAVAAWSEVYAGRVAPDRGHVVSLWD